VRSSVGSGTKRSPVSVRRARYVSAEVSGCSRRYAAAIERARGRCPRVRLRVRAASGLTAVRHSWFVFKNDKGPKVEVPATRLGERQTDYARGVRLSRVLFVQNLIPLRGKIYIAG